MMVSASNFQEEHQRTSNKQNRQHNETARSNKLRRLSDIGKVAKRMSRTCETYHWQNVTVIVIDMFAN